MAASFFLFCTPTWTRTKDLLIRSELFYPAELWVHMLIVFSLCCSCVVLMLIFFS